MAWKMDIHLPALTSAHLNLVSPKITSWIGMTKGPWTEVEIVQQERRHLDVEYSCSTEWVRIRWGKFNFQVELVAKTLRAPRAQRFMEHQSWNIAQLWARTDATLLTWRNWNLIYLSCHTCVLFKVLGFRDVGVGVLLGMETSIREL